MTVITLPMTLPVMGRILIVKLSSLGDIVHALPTVHNLKMCLDCEVDWVTQTHYVDFVSTFSDVDRVIPFYRKKFWRNLPRFLRELRREKYDYVIDLQGLIKSGIAVKLARAVEKIGPSYHREGSRMFYSDVAGEVNRQRHAVDQSMDVVEHLGFARMEPQFLMNLPEWVAEMPSPRVAIVPSSRWKSKNWPIQSFADVGRKLWEEAAASMFILGGPDDVAVCDEVQRELGGTVENLAGQTSLVELGSILGGMDLVIANDSGPMHLAAAQGVPVLAVFGPTDPLRTRPFGKWHRVMNGDLACQPCMSPTCQFGDPRCLNVVSPDDVATEALKMLAS